MVEKLFLDALHYIQFFQIFSLKIEPLDTRKALAFENAGKYCPDV